MAPKKKKERKRKLPNLKICVDNTDVKDSSSDASSVEEGQISEDDVAIAVELAKVVPQKPVLELKQPKTNRKLASPIYSDDESNLNADIDDLETFGVTKKPKTVIPETQSKFELGFDPTSKEVLEKREERAKRFGIKSNKLVPVTEEKIKELYESLSISPETRGERGLRLNVIHLRGCENCDASQLAAYFEPSTFRHVEWIDSSSCNVEWEDDRLAAHVMLQRSDDAYDTKAPATDVSNVTAPKKEEKKPEVKDTDRDEKMDTQNDDDVLDLLSSSDDESDSEQSHRRSKQTAKAVEQKPGPEAQSSMEIGEEPNTETASAADGDDVTESSSQRLERLSRARRVMPPGRWRIARPLAGNELVYMRFANRADRKWPGRFSANQTSYSYSSTRRRWFEEQRLQEIEESAQAILAGFARSRQPQTVRDVTRSRQLRTTTPDEDHSFDGRYDVSYDDNYAHDRWRHYADHDVRESRDYYGDDDDYAGDDVTWSSSSHARDFVYPDTDRSRAEPRIEIRRHPRHNSDSEQELDMEAELGELLRERVPEKRKMRMYADDEEELALRKRPYPKRELVQQAPAVTRRFQPDLRTKVTSRTKQVDLRSKLGRSRNTKSRAHKTSAFSEPQFVSPLVRHKQQTAVVDDDDVMSRDRSVSPILNKLRKYEKITIQVDRCDD